MTMRYECDMCKHLIDEKLEVNALILFNGACQKELSLHLCDGCYDFLKSIVEMLKELDSRDAMKLIERYM